MNITLRAQCARNQPTSPEAAAWRTLRWLRREGVHVRRQHPVGPYLLDFAVRKSWLAIEFDGGVHAFPDKALRDARKEVFLSGLGWRMLRLPNRLAFSPDHLLDAVRQSLRQPSPGGGATGAERPSGWGGKKRKALRKPHPGLADARPALPKGRAFLQVMS